MAPTTRQNTKRRNNSRRTTRARSGYYFLSKRVPRHTAVTKEDNERLLTLWKSGENLREVQRQYIWLWFDTYCTNVTARHYKRTVTSLRQELENRHKKQEQHIDRILLAMEFFQAHPNKSIGWLMTTYRIRFPLMEVTLTLRHLHIDTGDISTQTVRNATFGRLLTLVRKNITSLGKTSSSILYKLYCDHYYEQNGTAISTLVGSRVAAQAEELANALRIAYPDVSLDNQVQLRLN
jgi:hypothetical protein